MLPAVIEVYAATCAVSLKSDRLMSPSRLSPYPSNLKSLSSNLSSPCHLPLQKSSDLLRPVNIFQKYYRHLTFFQILPFQPHIEKTLRHEAEKPGFVGIISCHIRPLLQFKQNIKSQVQYSSKSDFFMTNIFSICSFLRFITLVKASEYPGYFSAIILSTSSRSFL